MPVEAEPEASECKDQVSAFLAARASGLSRDMLTKPYVCRVGESWCDVDPVCIARVYGMKLGEGESHHEMFPQGESY